MYKAKDKNMNNMEEERDRSLDIEFSNKEIRRSFGGLITKEDIKKAVKEKYPEAPEDELLLREKMETVFQEKHLKAYLAGKSTFTMGFNKKGKPMIWDVEEIWE